MITRFDIRCTGCGGGVRLRIAVGEEEHQHFYLICPPCSSALTGILQTDQEAAKLNQLLIDGKPADFEAADDQSVVTVFNDMPVDPAASSMMSPSGSPFMMHLRSLGESYEVWSQSRRQFLALCENDWHNVKRWWGFYVRQDWGRFDEHAREYWSDDWPSAPTTMQRHDAIHRALELLFVPLFPRGQYAYSKAAARQGLDSHAVQRLSAFSSNWSGEAEAGYRQENLFHLLELFIELRWALLPGLVLEHYLARGIEPDPNWRIMRDDYSRVRDLYINTFEQSYRNLPLVFGIANAAAGREPDEFPDGIRRDLLRLENSKAFKKETVLEQFPPWGPQLLALLDRNLRNAVGHSDSRHDLTSGDVLTPKRSYRYQDVVRLAAASIQVPLLCLDAIKLLLIFHRPQDTD